MTRNLAALVGCLVGTCIMTTSLSLFAAPCEPVHVLTDVSPLPEPWRLALDELVEKSAKPGAPWSCSGARISLLVDPDGSEATLRVSDGHGPDAERRVAAPSDLLPLGEALLALPIAAPTELAEAPKSPAASPERVERAEPPPAPPPAALPTPSEPRLLLGVAGGVHFAAPTELLWVGAELRGAIPFDAWSAGVWARYDAPSQSLDAPPHDFSASQFGVGLLVGRTIASEDADLAIELRPAVAIVAMEADLPDGHVEGGKVDPRLGAALRLAIPVTRLLRASIQLDGDLAPLGLGGGADRRINAALSPIPTFTVGGSFGVEVAIP